MLMHANAGHFVQKNKFTVQLVKQADLSTTFSGMVSFNMIVFRQDTGFSIAPENSYHRRFITDGSRS